MPAQLRMLDDEWHHPAGLRYQPDFVSPEEEAALIGHIRALPLAPFQFGAFEGKRRVVSFGSRYDYMAQRLPGADPLPDWTTPFPARIERFAVLAPGSIAQVLCTEYDTGTGLDARSDVPTMEHRPDEREPRWLAG